MAPVRAGSGASSAAGDDGSRVRGATCDPLPTLQEECARLAGEAAARGEFDRARELVDKAEHIAAAGSAERLRARVGALLAGALDANARGDARLVEQLLRDAQRVLDELGADVAGTAGAHR